MCKYIKLNKVFIINNNNNSQQQQLQQLPLHQQPLPTRNNLKKWGISSTSECGFCLNKESLLHVTARNSRLSVLSWSFYVEAQFNP